MSLSPNQIADLVIEGFASLGGGRSGTSFATGVSNALVISCEKQEYVDVMDILDSCIPGQLARSLLQLSLNAMKRFEDNRKPNLVSKFC